MGFPDIPEHTTVSFPTASKHALSNGTGGLVILNLPALKSLHFPQSPPAPILPSIPVLAGPPPGKKEVGKVCAHLSLGHKEKQVQGRTSLSRSWPGIRNESRIQRWVRNQKKAQGHFINEIPPTFLKAGPSPPKPFPRGSACSYFLAVLEKAVTSC